MKDEMEEGHFDKDGHFQWDKSKEVKDSWLDSIDWIAINPADIVKKPDENSSDADAFKDMHHDLLIAKYEEVLSYMKVGESVKKSLQRLGANSKKLSSIEKWRQKKAGIVDECAEKVTKLTELCNTILTSTGNMDIYEETFEFITGKVNSLKNKPTGSGIGHRPPAKMVVDDDLDMYADDFDKKEQEKLVTTKTEEEKETAVKENETNVPDVISWEFKWKEDDTEIHGPFGTEQMQLWVDEGYFKDGVLVRKTNADDPKFYSSKRIDFELYL